jgi:hypothetical protein
MHLDIQRCHKKYGTSRAELLPKHDTVLRRFLGDLIRYAPNQVLSLHMPDMSALYGHGSSFRKSKGYETMIPIPDGWSAMTSIDKSLHRNLRKVFRSGVTVEFLTKFEPAILRNMGVYFSQLMKDVDGEGWSMAKDMRRWSECLFYFVLAGRFNRADNR